MLEITHLFKAILFYSFALYKKHPLEGALTLSHCCKAFREVKVHRGLSVTDMLLEYARECEYIAAETKIIIYHYFYCYMITLC